jgi:hypothetical protein
MSPCAPRLWASCREIARETKREYAKQQRSQREAVAGGRVSDLLDVPGSQTSGDMCQGETGGGARWRKSVNQSTREKRRSSRGAQHVHTGSLPLLHSRHALPSKFLKPFLPLLNRCEHNIESLIACRQSLVVPENSNMAKLAPNPYLLAQSRSKEGHYDINDASAREIYALRVPESTLRTLQSSRRWPHRASVVDRDAQAH